jgi:hypothetical protein
LSHGVHPLDESDEETEKAVVMQSLPIPKHLLAHAYVSENGEPAWPEYSALQVLSWAAEVGLPLLGVEIWLPTIPGPTIPTPFIYALDLNQFPGEPTGQFQKRTNREAAEYVRSFAWDARDVAHHGNVPYFNFTFASTAERVRRGNE